MEFKRPSDLLADRDFYDKGEVGVTHPKTPAYVRLADNGDVEIIAAEGLGMVFHPANRSITIIADTIKLMTKDDDGLRWNQLAFNPKSTTFTEPTFLSSDLFSIKDVFKDTDKYLGDQ